MFKSVNASETVAASMQSRWTVTLGPDVICQSSFVKYTKLLHITNVFVCQFGQSAPLGQ